MSLLTKNIPRTSANFDTKEKGSGAYEIKVQKQYPSIKKICLSELYRVYITLLELFKNFSEYSQERKKVEVTK